MAVLSCKFVYAYVTCMLLVIAAGMACPSSHCVCGGTPAVEMRCDIQGQTVKISLLPDTYLVIKCDNAPMINYDSFPNLSANRMSMIKSVTFKDCPLPSTSIKEILTTVGVNKTLSLIYQNSRNTTYFLERKYFAGLHDVTKLLLSLNGVMNLPDNLFMDMHNLTWLNIRSNGINFTEKLFQPLERLETLEISHNHMTNISANLFSHLSFLRKLSLWQSNVTMFSKDLFSGVDVLEELDLSSNGLNELPPSIFHPLTKLKKLTLFSNKFAFLPSNLFTNNEKLDTVVIFNNDVKLQRLPHGLFSKLPNLKEVYIQRCEIEEIPQDLFADSTKITNISLAYNAIENLPEAVFNDQINLLDLDLSHNNIEDLKPKLFTSLVKLERLQLSYNNLHVILEAPFSSLLSLIFLDVENNNIKLITSYLFSNNKQRMSINMAYNCLDFDNTKYLNKSWVSRGQSPFAFTYNLRLLNLSHNELKTSFGDWWFNSHEILDLSYNKISKIWNPSAHKLTEEGNFRKLLNIKPPKQVWLSHNPLECDCQSFNFLYALENRNTKGSNVDQLNCGLTQRMFCNQAEAGVFFIVPLLFTINVLATIAVFVYRKRIYKYTKQFVEYQTFTRANHVVLCYSAKDEEFVLQEVIPELARCKNIKVHMRPVYEGDNKSKLIKKFKDSFIDSKITVVVFSPSYLMSVYSDVNITKIREVMKAKSTVHLFVDIGPENSIYAFLKDQRDPRSSIIWNGPNFSNLLMEMLKKNDSKSDLNKVEISEKSSSHMYDRMRQYKNTFSRLNDSSSLSALDTLAHSQV